MAGHVWMTLEETGGVWQCPEDVVEVAQKRGWVQCDAPEQDDSHLKDPKPPAPKVPEAKPEPKPEPVKFHKGGPVAG